MSKSDAGKGDDPRNCFSKQFKDNFDQIEGFGYKPWWQRKEEERMKRESKRKKKASAWLNSPEFEGVIIHEPNGWEDQEEFLTKKLTKDEFIFKLAQSVATIPKNINLD